MLPNMLANRFHFPFHHGYGGPTIAPFRLCSRCYLSPTRSACDDLNDQQQKKCGCVAHGRSVLSGFVVDYW